MRKHLKHILGWNQNHQIEVKINWDKWICIVLLWVVVYDRLCIVLGIYDTGFQKYKSHGMWRISKRKSRIYHYHYKFEMYDYVGCSFIISKIQNSIRLNTFRHLSPAKSFIFDPLSFWDILRSFPHQIPWSFFWDSVVILS